MTSYVFNKGGTNPETNSDNMSFLAMKIGFVGITAMLLMSLVLFCVMAFA